MSLSKLETWRIYYHPTLKMYRAYIYLDDDEVYIGKYDTHEQGYEAWQVAQYNYDNNIPIRPCAECGKRKRLKHSQWCTICRHSKWVRAEKASNFNTRNRKLLKKYYYCIDCMYERIDPITVFERDYYICYICGVETSLMYKFNDDEAPTVDHVISFSKGGAHRYNNMRCACRRCNSIKQEHVLSDAKQLLIDKGIRLTDEVYEMVAACEGAYASQFNSEWR